MKNALTVRQETCAKLRQAFIDKQITIRECVLPAILFRERDIYARNPRAKMRPGFFERENEVADILRKIAA